MNKIVLAVCILFFIASLQAAPIDTKTDGIEKRAVLIHGGIIRPVVVRPVVVRPVVIHHPAIINKVVPGFVGAPLG